MKIQRKERSLLAVEFRGGWKTFEILSSWSRCEGSFPRKEEMDYLPISMISRERSFTRVIFLINSVHNQGNDSYSVSAYCSATNVPCWRMLDSAHHVPFLMTFASKDSRSKFGKERKQFNTFLNIPKCLDLCIIQGNLLLFIYMLSQKSTSPNTLLPAFSLSSRNVLLHVEESQNQRIEMTCANNWTRSTIIQAYRLIIISTVAKPQKQIWFCCQLVIDH